MEAQEPPKKTRLGTLKGKYSEIKHSNCFGESGPRNYLNENKTLKFFFLKRSHYLDKRN